ncbi:MAG: tRNA (adenosine(37)-N6)-dimethylallyltransferase MiaA [Anaerolineaceae bacterium]|nr:tRNA (adenosine(37)-N6)-dimethylallyltransferase MiaA [Anaerolineaceae bacterium]
MRLNDIQQPLIVLLGPTAVGKTALSIELAQRLNGEIISSDSRLFYRGMDIGTAKPTIEEMQKVKHHLIDVADPDETWSLALFQRAAFAAIDAIHARNKVPLLVGGTGQYVHALIYGWDLPSQAPDGKLRDVLNRWGKEIGAESLHQKLSLIDEPAAKNIEWQNMRRTVRALEVIFRSGMKFSTQRRKGKQRYPMLLIGLWRPREEIFQRIDERIERMFEEGFCEEVQMLLNAGYSPKFPSMASIGYRETAAFLHGEMTLEDAKARMRKITHQFVRRQANWFKETDPNIHWFDVREPDISNQIIDVILESGKWLQPEKGGK